MATNGHSSRLKISFLPLESNPSVFTDLIHALGVSSVLTFHDVYSISDSELLSAIPRPVYALVLVVPALPEHDAVKAAEEENREEYWGCGEGEDVVWFKQTIHNACGLYAVLHAVCNGFGKDFITQDSVLDKLLRKSLPLMYQERAEALENSSELEAIHTAMALRGDTAAPESAEDEVYYHYIALVRSKSGKLFEMDGDRKGPVDLGLNLGGEDLLGEVALSVVKKIIEREEGRNLGFNLMALTHDE